jgi:hypothetical protein
MSMDVDKTDDTVSEQIVTSGSVSVWEICLAANCSSLAFFACSFSNLDVISAMTPSSTGLCANLWKLKS